MLLPKTLANALILLPFLVIVLGKPTLPLIVQENATSIGKPSSPWLKKVVNQREPGCWNRPWICNQGEYPKIKKLCCKNRCVDVTSDVNNCGLCGIKCAFTWQCCHGICIDTNINPFHCGRCDHRCPFRSFCFYGMCGYAAPVPPFPFPPHPPFPPKPEPPHPPFPPKPEPPHPPFGPFPPKPEPPHPPFGPFPPKPEPPHPPFGPFPFPPKPEPPPFGSLPPKLEPSHGPHPLLPVNP